MGSDFLHIETIEKDYPVLYENPSKTRIQEQKDCGEPYNFSNVIQDKDSFFVYRSSNHLSSNDNFDYKHKRQNNERYKIFKYKRDRSLYLYETPLNNPLEVSVFNTQYNYDYEMPFDIARRHEEGKALQLKSLDMLDATTQISPEFRVNEVDIDSIVPFISELHLTNVKIVNDLVLSGCHIYFENIKNPNNHSISLNLDNATNKFLDGRISIEQVDKEFWNTFKILNKSIFTKLVITECKDVNLSANILDNIDRVRLDCVDNLYIGSVDLYKLHEIVGSKNCQIDTLVINADIFFNNDFCFDRSDIHIKKVLLKNLTTLRFCGVKQKSEYLNVIIDEIECIVNDQKVNTITIEPTSTDSSIKYKGQDIRRKKKVNI